jgi:AraC family transcriptional regulator
MSSITSFAIGLDHAGACAVGRDRRCDGGHLYPAGADVGLLHRRARLRCPPGEPDAVAGQELVWGGVSICEMDLRWPDGFARHDITCQNAVLWVVTEQVGGQYEHRVDPDEPLRPARGGPRIMSLMPPGASLWGYAHSIRSVRSLRVTFNLEKAGLALGNRRLDPAFAAPRLMFTSEPLWQMTRLLVSECGRRSGVDGLFGESLATALCVELLRLGGAANQPMARGGLAPWQMRRITEYMEAHLGDAIQLSDFAQLAGMSRSHFSRAFRTTTGMPPHRWQLHARIRRAQELLLDTTLPLAEIALRTGFADQSHFTRTFQRHVGTSPGAWRRTRRN